jgi:gelsolin
MAAHSGLRKQQNINILGSNIAFLGTDLEKNARATAAACEEQWRIAGKEAGLQIWRIEKFRVVPWPKEQYGKFYQGDSYIVLKTKKVQNALSWDIHFWLGLETTADEAGTAAYKTVELDDFLGTKPVQHREVQGYESDLFLSYFPNSAIIILSGGIESGFNRVKPEEYRTRLLHVKGKLKCCRVSEVPLSVASLNSGDCFILDKGLNLYQVNGAKSSSGERIKAAQLCRAIDDERKGLATVHVAEQGDGDKSFWPVFWEALGGEGPISDASGSDDDATKQSEHTRRLLRLKELDDGTFSFTEVAVGHFNKGMLDSSDVFILDQGQEVFVWVGKGSSPKERRYGIQYAQNYLVQYNRPKALPISRILEGGENEVFETAFKIF